MHSKNCSWSYLLKTILCSKVVNNIKEVPFCLHEVQLSHAWQNLTCWKNFSKKPRMKISWSCLNFKNSNPHINYLTIFLIKILGLEQIVDVDTTCANSTTLLIYLLHLHTRIQGSKLRKQTQVWEKVCINSIQRPQKLNTLMKTKYKTQP